jgi:tetratricopeptide (TPR) repeat protein
MAHDVFISYSSVDKHAADAACATFEKNGIRCWIAPRDVPAGSEWAEAIIEAIESARIMVLIFSTHSNESRQVRREIELAVNRGLTIMPLRLEQVAPSRSMAYYMAGVHWIDALTQPLDQHFRKMVEWIKPHLGEGTRAEPPKAKAGSGSIDSTEAARLIDAARELRNAGRAAESVAAYRQVIARIGEPPDLKMGGMLALALGGLALSHEKLQHWDEAIAAYDDLLRRYRNSLDPYLRERVALALVNRGFPLNESGRRQETLASYDEFEQRFGTAKEAVYIKLQARVAHSRGIVLDEHGRKQDAIAAYDAAIRRYEGSADPELLEVVAMSHYNRAVVLENLGRRKEAIAGLEDITRRYTGNGDDRLRKQVERAWAFLGKLR